MLTGFWMRRLQCKAADDCVWGRECHCAGDGELVPRIKWRRRWGWAEGHCLDYVPRVRKESKDAVAADG